VAIVPIQAATVMKVATITLEIPRSESLGEGLDDVKEKSIGRGSELAKVL